MFNSFKLSSVALSLISSLFPLNKNFFVVILFLVPNPNQTKPTGLFFDPPFGPAIPVTPIPTSALKLFTKL